jgi:hypothetical protein
MKYRYYLGSCSSRWEREFLFDNLSILRSLFRTTFSSPTYHSLSDRRGHEDAEKMVNSIFRLRGKDLPKIGDGTRPANCGGPSQGDRRRSVLPLVEQAQCGNNADKPRCQRHLEERKSEDFISSVLDRRQTVPVATAVV